MRVILPALSCACSEEEFLAGEAGDYQTTYIMGADGRRWKHVKLQGGGHFRFEVKSIPGEEPVEAAESQLEGELKFLPDGKIPRILLDQIILFFRQVMSNLGGDKASIKHGELEAMAHILWHPDRGYYVGIPEQKVSKAMVTYDPRYIASDTMIVVDIHSHNSMGAFYSGTDNRDDSDAVRVSGVAGNLHKWKHEMKFRFNYEAEKFELTVDDIFLPAENEVVVPQEWMDKVVEEKYTMPTIYRGQRGNQLGKPQGGSTAGVNKPQAGDRVVPPVRATVVQGVSMYLDSLNRRVIPKGMGNQWAFYDDPIPDYGMQLGLDGLGGPSHLYFGLDEVDDEIPFDGNRGTSLLEDDAYLDSLSNEGFMDADELDELEDISLRNLQRELAEDVEYEEVDDDEEESEEEDDPREQALMWMEALDDDDDALLEIIQDAHDRMTEEGRTKLAENGL